MKKLVFLLCFSAIAIVATAQSVEQVQQYVNIAPPETNTVKELRMTNPDTTGIVNDTDFSPKFNMAPNHPTLYGYGAGANAAGYLYGNNGSVNGYKEVAQGYKNNNHLDVCISGVLCWFGAKQSDLGSSATSKVVIKAYYMDTLRAYNIRNNIFNADTLNWAGPSTLSDSADILYADISTTAFTYVPFALPPWIWAVSDFAIGCDFTHLAAGDTVGLMSDFKNDAFNIDYAFHKTGLNKWIVSDELFSGGAASGGLDNEIALWAVVSPGTGIKEYYNGMKLTAYPNPSVDNAMIEYALEKDSKNVSLIIIDPTGKMIMETNYGNQSMGNYSVNLQTDNLASGSYFYQLRANGQIFTKQFVVSK